MIEVEKKFEAAEEQIKRVEKNANFMSEIKNKDIYYDNEDFELTKNDMFLRNRNGNFELKIFMPGGDSVDRYLELETEKEIKKKLDIPKEETIKNYLARKGYRPFGSWVTSRSRYEMDGFTIDIDSTDFGFNVIEIELMVEKEEDTEEAAQKILKFANELGIEREQTDGKVMTFINKRDSKKYEEIKKVWTENSK